MDNAHRDEELGKNERGGSVRLTLLLGAALSIVVIGLVMAPGLYLKVERHGLVNNLKSYVEAHQRLPNQDDQELMRELGFELRVDWFPILTGSPGNWQLIWVSGFDGPYDTYTSSTDAWAETC